MTEHWHTGGCGLSILRDIRKPPENAPGQLTLGGPAWAVGLKQMTSRALFQP